MRITQKKQADLFDSYADHEIGNELEAMSQLLDEFPEIYDIASQDLISRDTQEKGRRGISVETVVRCVILKQYFQLTYQDLSFHLADSISFQAFARLSGGVAPKKSSLQQTMSAITDKTWEAINRRLLSKAEKEKIESGKMVRIDSTVTETDIHPPTDSSLLWDCVRAGTSLLEQSKVLPGAEGITFTDHQRRAKKRAHEIFNGGSKKRKARYKDLIAITKKVCTYLEDAKLRVPKTGEVSLACLSWHGEVEKLLPLTLQVLNQTERRILQKEKVPVAEKIFSIFEPHTDIIIKGSRAIEYGHKLNLASGKSGLILDLVVETGNPSDSGQFIPMLERQINIYGRSAAQVAADGGYASQENIDKAKALGTKDIAFNKKRGIAVEDMATSKWIYRKLKNFRAGIEGNISCLKRAYGLTRCTWKGLQRFKAYVWSSVVAYNLSAFTRLLNSS